MRRFILRSQIFHLNLSGMQLGANVHKLIEVIKASTTLAVVHMSENHVPQEVEAYIDSSLPIPDVSSKKISSFRPLKDHTDPTSRPGTDRLENEINNGQQHYEFTTEKGEVR